VVVDSLTEITGINFIRPQGTLPPINASFRNLPLREGLDLLFRQNGFQLIRRKNIFEIRKTNELANQTGAPGMSNSNLWIQVDKDSLISIDAQNVPLNVLINRLFMRLPFQHVVYTQLKGTLSLKVNTLPLVNILDLIFNNTSYTYRREGDIFLIGSKEMKGMTTQKLIPFNYLKITDVVSLIPARLREHLQLLTIKEHNAIFAIGPIDMLKELEQFRNSIDHPVAQILLEVIVVDFSTGNIRELKIEAQKGQSPADSLPSLDSFIPGYDILLSATNVNKYYSEIGKFFGFKNIGKLPPDFKLRLKALEQKKIANIRSRPQLAALNGHTAKMDIGFTQYYKLNSRTALPGTVYSPFNPGQNENQNQNQDYYNPYFTTERFVSIQATISLEITPWVSSNGEITVEIHPKFETPIGKLDASTPPTIQKREISSTVRLKDGETIILGGLIENKEEETVSQLPILGDIPLLGNLFKSKNYNKSKQELIIYITPHLYYGETNNETGFR
jgi:type IV pilus assembly protein PilQ